LAPFPNTGLQADDINLPRYATFQRLKRKALEGILVLMQKFRKENPNRHKRQNLNDPQKLEVKGQH